MRINIIFGHSFCCTKRGSPMPGRDANLKTLLDERTEALRACEAGFRNIIDRCADGIVVVDCNGLIRLINPAAAVILGRKTGKLQGKPFGFPTVTEKTTELEIEHGKGKKSFVETLVVDTEWEGDCAHLVTLRDITERKRLEAESEHLASIPRLNPNPIIELDAGGRMIFCNRAAEEVIKNAGMQDGNNPFSPADLPEILRDLQGGKPLQYTRKVEINGSIFGERIYLAPQFNTVRIYANDITESVRAEEALRFSEARYRALHRDNPTMLATLGTDFTILSVNPACASQLGYATDELEGQSVLKLFYEEDRPAVVEQLRMCLRNPKRVHRWQFRKVRKDGELLWVEELAHAVYDLNGVLNILLVCQDITERKRVDEEIEILNTNLAARAAELEAAYRELEAFSHTVSHDLRAPLTNIGGYSQIVLDLCADRLDEGCRGYIREIYRGTERMNQLIDTILSFSRLGRGELRREPVNLCEMAREIAAELQVAQPERRAFFSIPEGLTVNGDPKLLRIVLENLLGNAWKYSGSRENAQIEFGVAESAGKQAYFVRDNGAGFDMGEADKLFIPFQRLHSAEGFEGYGIGLATAERIIRRHGGRIWAESKPGEGATFYFTIPD